MTTSDLSEKLLSDLVCPRDHLALLICNSTLFCPAGHSYPIVQGIPVLLLEDREQTIGVARDSLAAARAFSNGGVDDPWFVSTLGINEAEKRDIQEAARRSDSDIDPVVRFMVGATNGILYRDLIGSLAEYPIPDLRLPRGDGKRLLDIGCNWGRWSVAAARLKYRPVGIDPSLGAVLAARRVTRQLGLEADFVVGDARFLPFADSCFEVVFSYSVLQHFAKSDAHVALTEAGRVLKSGGQSLIQMPNRFGVRCLYHQARRRFRTPVEFEVRYWSVPELRQSFAKAIGAASFSVDCFFGLGLQAADIRLLPLPQRILVRASEVLRSVSHWFRWLNYLADSVYVHGRKF